MPIERPESDYRPPPHQLATWSVLSAALVLVLVLSSVRSALDPTSSPTNAMAVNLFFLGTEVYTAFSTESAHSVHTHFLRFGTDEGIAMMPLYTSTALAFDLLGLITFMIPILRHHLPLLSFAAVLAASSVFIENGMGLPLPGMCPDMLGEVFAYEPSRTEHLVGFGIWAVGGLAFMLMTRIAMAISSAALGLSRVFPAEREGMR